MPKEKKSYPLGPGVVPKRILDEAEERGWAPTEEFVKVKDRRVIYEVTKDGQRPVGLVAERYAGDATVVPLFVGSLVEGRRRQQRVVAVANLVSTGDIASRLRLKHGTIQKWTQRYADMPKPIIEFTIVDIYDWSEILGWVERKFPAYAARVADKWRVVSA